MSFGLKLLLSLQFIGMYKNKNTDKRRPAKYAYIRVSPRFVRKVLIRQYLNNYLTMSLLSLYSPYKITLLHAIGLM